MLCFFCLVWEQSKGTQNLTVFEKSVLIFQLELQGCSYTEILEISLLPQMKLKPQATQWHRSLQSPWGELSTVFTQGHALLRYLTATG